MRAAPADLTPPRATIVNTQRKSGNAAAYNSVAYNNSAPLPDGGATPLPMQLAYTPTLPVWWAVSAGVGQLYKTDAAYNYIYTYLSLTPADQDGISGGQLIGTQYNGVQTYESHTVRRVYRLAPGVPYVCALVVGGGSGGTWQYYCGGGYLWIESEAWLQ